MPARPVQIGGIPHPGEGCCQLVRPTETQVPLRRVIRYELQLQIPGENCGGRLGPPTGQTGDTVGRVTDEGEIVGYGFRMDPELLDHGRLVHDFLFPTVVFMAISSRLIWQRKILYSQK